MAVLRIAYTRLRAEEKLLAAAASREGIPATMEDVTDGVFGAQLPAERGDVVLARCISHSQNEALAQILESRGVRVVNPPAVMARCGDKLATTLALEEGGIPQPAWRTAFSPEGALAAAAAEPIPAAVDLVSISRPDIRYQVNRQPGNYEPAKVSVDVKI